MFALAGLFVAPNFLDLSKFKNEFSATIKEVTGLEPVIRGNAKVSFLPYPKLTLGNISITNPENAHSGSILSADGVEVNFTFASLAKGKFDPSSITLLRPHIEIIKMQDGKQNWLNIIKSKSETSSGNNLKIPRHVIINNGTITYQAGSSKTSIDYISANIDISSPQGPFNFKGSFQRESATVNFSGKIGNLDENSDSEFNITSDAFDFSMKGNYTPGDNFEINGGADLNVKNLSKFTESFFNNSSLLTKIKSNETLSIKGDFVISKEITSFRKLVIASDSIKGKGNIDILYSANTGDSIQWDVGLDIDKINSDTLRKTSVATKTEDGQNPEDSIDSIMSASISSYRFDLPQNISALLKLSLGEIIYNGDKVTNLLVDTEIFNGKAIIHSVSAQMPGNSKIEFTGNVDNNGIRPLFTGKIRAYGDSLRSIITWLQPDYSFIPADELNSFLFSCDLSITPRILTISNIYGSVDRTLVNGSVLMHPVDTTPSLNADLKIDRLNFDKYNATPQIANFISKFRANAKDSNLDTSWLKILNYKMAISVSGEDMVYNNNNINNFSASIGAAKGLLSIQNITLDSNLVKLRGKIGVNLLKEPPEINVDMNASAFDTAAFILPSSPSETSEEETPKANSSIWSKDPINLMGINRFNGKLNLNFDELKFANTTLKNMILKGDLKKDIFSISECKSNFGEKGKVSIKGSAGVSAEAPSIGISVVASDIELQDIFKSLKSNNTTKGTLYLGGVVKTFGLSFYEWINELKASAKLSTRNVEISNFDLPIIIEQSRKLFSVIDMNAVVQNALQTGSTKFMSIDGNLATDKSILQAKDFILATDKSRGALVGNISLHTMQLKGLAKIDYIPEYNKKVTLGLSLDGTIPDKISYKLDKSSLEQYITGKASR